MNGLGRFVKHGLVDLDHRLGRIAAPLSNRDDVALGIVESSRAFSLVASILRGVETAARGSVFYQRVRHASARWAHMTRSDRHRATGSMLLLASTLHVVLSTTFAANPGWLWLVVPVIAMSIGVVFIAVGRGADQVRTKP
jgi:hypothetical protein